MLCAAVQSVENKKAVTASYVCSVFPATCFEPVQRGASVQSKASQKTLLNTQHKKVTTSVIQGCPVATQGICNKDFLRTTPQASAVPGLSGEKQNLIS